MHLPFGKLPMYAITGFQLEIRSWWTHSSQSIFDGTAWLDISGPTSGKVKSALNHFIGYAKKKKQKNFILTICKVNHCTGFIAEGH